MGQPSDRSTLRRQSLVLRMSSSSRGRARRMALISSLQAQHQVTQSKADTVGEAAERVRGGSLHERCQDFCAAVTAQGEISSSDY